MNENTDQKNVENGENTQSADNRKSKPKWMKIGCGCLVAVIIGFIALVVIAHSCSTPEEREQWAADRAERDKQYQADRAERERRNEAERQQKQATADQAAAEKKAGKEAAALAAKAEKLKPEAYLMARTAIRKHLGGTLPGNLTFGTQDDCVISWQQYDGPNRFCVKMALLNKTTGARNYLFVDLDYLGDEKWNVLAIRKE